MTFVIAHLIHFSCVRIHVPVFILFVKVLCSSPPPCQELQEEEVRTLQQRAPQEEVKVSSWSIGVLLPRLCGPCLASAINHWLLVLYSLSIPPYYILSL